MAEDTYPEELYVGEIDILDYDDVYYWGEHDIPDPSEWGGDFYEQHETTDEEFADDEDYEDGESDEDIDDWWQRR